jgi:hypothetical protein
MGFFKCPPVQFTLFALHSADSPQYAPKSSSSPPASASISMSRLVLFPAALLHENAIPDIAFSFVFRARMGVYRLPTNVLRSTKSLLIGVSAKR